MAVKRIVANVGTLNPHDAQAFYGDLLGLKIVMDHGWIVTFADEETVSRAQIAFAAEGGSGTPVPDLSIEVDDVDAIYARAVSSGFDIAYRITDEPWGVRRFFVRDPFGKLVNILSHHR